MEYVELHDISVRRLWDTRSKKKWADVAYISVGLWGNYAKTVAASVQINFSKKSEHMLDFQCHTYYRSQKRAQTNLSIKASAVPDVIDMKRTA